MNSLHGKIALVTGASRGIGYAAALELAKAGCHVVVSYYKSQLEGEKLKKEIESAGQECILIKTDVSKSGQVKEMVRKSIYRFNSIDILVNNAGISRPQAIESITEDDWDEIISVNLKSCFLVTQAVLPSMRERKFGRIINMSSVAAQIGGVVGPHYAASKAGIIGLTHSYGSQLVKEGITVNAIAPALIKTEMVKSNPFAKPDLIPIGRFGQVKEVTDVILMLATNGYITGQTINVNGGWYMS